jgi:hypothetical protein
MEIINVWIIAKKYFIFISCFYSLFVLANDSINTEGRVGRIVFVGAILEAPCQFSISDHEINVEVEKYYSSNFLPMAVTSCDANVLSGASYRISIPQGDNVIYKSESELINIDNKSNIKTKVDEVNTAKNYNLSLHMRLSEKLTRSRTVGVTIDYW